MSEQSQSNFQALGAGLLGFVAVMAVGGGAMLVHRSHQAKAGAPAVAAAAPIDLGAPRPAAPPVRAERRAQSPAPLIGESGTEEAPEGAAPAPAAPAPASPRAIAPEPAAPSPEAAPLQNSRTRLQVAEHAESSPGETSAVAEVKDAPQRERAKAAPLKKAVKKAAAAAPLGDPSGAAVASVHYGATSRSELMGRAAGPVYNIKGGARPAKSVTGKMADDASAQISDLRKQLDSATNLAPEDRAKLQTQLDDAVKRMSGAAAAAQ